MPTCPLSFREKNLTFKDKEIVVTAVTSFLAKHKQSGDLSIDLRRGRGGPCQVLAEELVAERDELSLTLFEVCVIDCKLICQPLGQEQHALLNKVQLYHI